jgi:hypothetical protein
MLSGFGWIYAICLVFMVISMNQVDSLSRYRYKMYAQQVERKDLPPAQWFDQQLDHFDQTARTTWKQVRPHMALSRPS